jgi:hypothetical protein
MTIIPYRSNAKDTPVLDDITSDILHSLDTWYGEGTCLQTANPEIRSYRNCFILRYPVTASNGTTKTILTKIRRKPKMDALWQAISADIHANIPNEYASLVLVYGNLSGMDQDFGVIRPLKYLERYHAIVMEEFPARTLRQLLVDKRHAQDRVGMHELIDAARKTGKWLRCFHHSLHAPTAMPYSPKDILDLVEGYALPLQEYSHGRLQAQLILDMFSRKVEDLQIDSMLFSQSHADMTCDNVLYSDDSKVCILDIKTRIAPIYSDLGLILTHPETFKSQIFSAGMYFSDSLLKEYRAAILTGYFENENVDEFLVKLFSAVKILDKWTMYEELMSKYRGIKYLLSFPIGPYVTAYFHATLKKHLSSISASGNNTKTNKDIGPDSWMGLLWLAFIGMYQACLNTDIFFFQLG